MNDIIPTNDTSNSTASNKFKEATGVTIALLTLEAAFALFGAMGNMLVCAVIVTRPNMKTVMNCYLLSLAAADLGILLVLFPLAILDQQHPDKYFLGKAFCLYMQPTLEIFIAASIWSITVIAIERYFTVVRSSFVSVHRRGNIPRRVYFTILAIWLLSFLLFCLPLFFIWGYEEGDSPSTSKCNLENLELFKIFAIYIAVGTYLMPLVVICFTSCRIMMKLRKSREFHVKMRGETAKEPLSRRDPNSICREESLRDSRARNIAKKMTNQSKRILTPLVVLFALSMLPINTLRFMNAFWEGTSQLSNYSILFNVAVFCFVINSAMNPVIYFIASHAFRAGFRDAWNKASARISFFQSRYTFQTRASLETRVKETKL